MIGATSNRTLLFFLFLAVLSACTNRQVIKAEATPADKAQYDIPEEQLLDVSIAIFDPGIPEDEKTLEKENIFPEVRKAEARYMPYALKRTLEQTGHWGAVRVVPSETNSTDVQVEGQIVSSDGEVLTVKIDVRDATGRVWLEKEYTHTASKYSYRESRLGDQDPFQALYNTIANEMLAARDRLDTEDIETIRTISELKFAADLSPKAFGQHLKPAKRDRYEINRLPAKDDPMMDRIRKIRERDYMLVDTLDYHYANFYAEMEKPYQDWRKNSYEEVMALREVKRSARNRMLMGAAAVLGGLLAAGSGKGPVTNAAGTVAVLGGAAVFKSGLDKHAESKIHVDALQELGDSFDAAVEPIVVEVEGKTITLTGSAEHQYEEWRRLLRKIYAAETGFSSSEPSDTDQDD
jgi:outer membrane lipoprotein SlyB